jgi:hypothetical protein
VRVRIPPPAFLRLMFDGEHTKALAQAQIDGPLASALRAGYELAP